MRRAVGAACLVMCAGLVHGQESPAPASQAAVEQGLPDAQAPAATPPATDQPDDAEGPQAPVPLVGEVGIETGRVSWYGRRFTGRRTACGTRFDPKALTMAHPSLPCGSRVRVRNPANGREVIVTVADRGPFVAGRIADLSRAAARRLGMLALGSATLELQALP